MAGRVAIIGYLSIDTISGPAGCAVDVPGGAALYSALAAHIVGAAVTLFASIGEDYPIEALALINRIGIETGFIRRVADATRRSCIRYSASGTRVSSHYRDPRWWEATEYLVPPLPLALEFFDIVVVNPVPPPILHEALGRATHANITSIVDTSEPFAFAGRDSILAALAAMSIFAASREETRTLCPRIDDDSAARELASRGPIVVQKRGAQGVFLARGQNEVEPFPATPVMPVDQTGAGDAFVGALAANLSERKPLQESIRAAQSVAARTVSAVGPGALGLNVETSSAPR
jgi:ribokinase